MEKQSRRTSLRMTAKQRHAPFLRQGWQNDGTKRAEKPQAFPETSPGTPELH
jgi:hypothetical protein